MSELIEIRLKLYEETVAKVHKLTEIYQCETKAETVKRCVNLALSLIDELQAGGEIRLIRADGSEHLLTLKE